MLRITAISDTHCLHQKLGKLIGGDILIHAGDFSSIGTRSQVNRFIEWFGKQDYNNKIFIAGNHDLCFESEKLQTKKEAYFYGMPDDQFDPVDGKPMWLERLLDNLPTGVFYLENQSINVEGIKIWGSPVSPKFGWEWAFNKTRGYEINEIWNLIPNDTDMVITHTPMNMYLDRVLHSCQYVGCSDLYSRLNEVKPLLHICGHVHEGYGYKETKWGHTINASIVQDWDELNNPVNIICDFQSRTVEYV